MTIQEAIESGKPFKRMFYDDQYIVIDLVGPVNEFFIEDRMGYSISLSADDILATDWEIK